MNIEVMILYRALRKKQVAKVTGMFLKSSCTVMVFCKQALINDRYCGKKQDFMSKYCIKLKIIELECTVNS
jgi:hypothetical protein